MISYIRILKTDLNLLSSLLEIGFPTFLILSPKFLKISYSKRVFKNAGISIFGEIKIKKSKM